MQDAKPSSRELSNKLKDALEAFDADPNRVFILDSDPSIHIENNMDELDLDDVDAYWDLVYECIGIAIESPSACYAHKTRLKSDYSTLKDQYLWPFKVSHPNYDKKIYFKFCIQLGEGEKNYIHINCHGHRY